MTRPIKLRGVAEPVKPYPPHYPQLNEAAGSNPPQVRGIGATPAIMFHQVGAHVAGSAGSAGGSSRPAHIARGHLTATGDHPRIPCTYREPVA